MSLEDEKSGSGKSSPKNRTVEIDDQGHISKIIENARESSYDYDQRGSIVRQTQVIVLGDIVMPTTAFYLDCDINGRNVIVETSGIEVEQEGSSRYGAMYRSVWVPRNEDNPKVELVEDEEGAVRGRPIVRNSLEVTYHPRYDIENEKYVFEREWWSGYVKSYGDNGQESYIDTDGLDDTDRKLVEDLPNVLQVEI